jgi:sortase A
MKRPALDLESFLFALGFVSLGAWAALTFAARAYQQEANRVVERWRPAVATATQRSRVEAWKSGVVGKLEIPAGRISAIVAEGIDDRTLDRAIGHVPGTSLPGEPGNVGLVAHRDTYFRGLERVRVGDEVRIECPDGIHRYRVTRTQVVSPHAVEVLAPTPRPALTLVTCYPFHVLGPAPRRFVVRAEPMASADAAAAAF